ncbi:MarR family winged helix-turn-helix transcriptional regulator [Lentilactobacillus parabuchneri]|uniref:MarR family winged helix-turn-helix transcriptional regulator n=1 Tax=Lentilactobacillus parabuchneri TaxID=152331 RepID=UPI0026496047|nr:MarR family transcriptional regulator [Lentilactobacillus parabuchneri]MDN6435285.1 MarR family transcriptional regulator [Lentilactobacillus parabuchneri]
MTNDKRALLGKFFGFMHGTQRLARHQERPYHLRGQNRALVILAKEGTLIQSQLAEIMDIRPSSLTELLAKLEERGLITRTPDENDKRVTNVAITDEGKKLIQEDDSADDLLDEIFEGLSDEELTQLNDLMDKLNDSLKSKLPDRDEEPWGPHGHGHHGPFGRPPFGGPHGGPHGGPRGPHGPRDFF